MRQNFNKPSNKPAQPSDQEQLSFIYAAMAGNKDALNTFLDKYPGAIDIRPENTYLYGTALDWAIQSGRKDAVELLLNRGASVTATYQGFNVAILNAGKADADIIELLLNRSPNLTANDKGLALINAAEGLNIGVVKLLLTRGPLMNVKSGRGKTALEVLQDVQKDLINEYARLKEINEKALPRITDELETARQITTILKNRIALEESIFKNAKITVRSI
jgi:hypothetical protein